MKLQAVFLDAGGTLLVEHPHRSEIYARAARERGRPVSGPQMRTCMYRTHASLPLRVNGHFRYTRGWFQAYVERIFGGELGLPAEEVVSATEELLARFADPATFRALPGAAELLAHLRKRGLRLGVISNWGEPLPAILEGLGLGRNLDFVLASAAEECEKPDPVLFARAAALAGVAPHRCVHAGDDLERDVQGARAAGILAVLVERAFDPLVPPEGARAAEGPPDLVRVRDLRELERWILERAA